MLDGDKKLKIEDGLRKIVLIELLFPAVLLTFGIYHGFLQVLYRSGILQQESVGGIEYYQGLTIHGVVNAVVFTTFFAVAFGHILIRYYLDKKINIKAAGASLGLMLLGTLMAAWAMFTGKATVLYTFYPPLKAHPAFYFGLVFFVIGSWIAFFSWIPPYLQWRKENPGTKTPMGVLGIMATFIVWFTATIPVAVEIIFLLIPWSLGLVPTVNVVLARTLFWFFGHPLVYFWLLPSYIMYYVMLPKLAGGKLYSDFAGRFAFMMFIVFSCPIGLHHQYTEPGIQEGFKMFQGLLTLLIALPSLITAFTLAASLEYGAKQNGGKGFFQWWSKLPYRDEENRWLFSYLFCGLTLFVFGGITGIINASYGMNRVVHNTAWMPGHFHMTVAGPVFLSFIGMVLLLSSQLLGKRIRVKMFINWPPYLWLAGMLIFSTGLSYGGAALGEPRRTNLGLTYLNPNSPLFRADWKIPTAITAIGGSIMTIAMIIYFVILFSTLFSKSEAEPMVSLPTSEVLHDENISWVRNLKPWVVAAVLALFISYGPPLYEIFQSNIMGSAPFGPDSPISEGK
jgi:cytochrome c oxidase subunit I